MANGDVLAILGSGTENSQAKTVLMLDAAAGNTDGAWVETEGYNEVYLILEGPFGASVSFFADNSAAAPAVTGGTKMHSGTYDAPDVVAHEVLPARMRAKVSGYSSGAVTCKAHFKH